MEIKEWIVNNIKNNGIILEAGVVDGEDTLFFSEHCKYGHVYGFEPIKELYDTSCEKLKIKNNVTLYNLALGDIDDAVVQMNVSYRKNKIWGSSSILRPKTHLMHHPQIEFKHSAEAVTITLDKWARENNINSIEMMWLDIQGYEPVVLGASRDAVYITKYIYTEVSLEETYEKVETYEQYIGKLKEIGFDVVFEDLRWKDMGNILLKNRKYL